eukprot:2923833-Rhodomonas_salina.2
MSEQARCSLRHELSALHITPPTRRVSSSGSITEQCASQFNGAATRHNLHVSEFGLEDARSFRMPCPAAFLARDGVIERRSSGDLAEIWRRSGGDLAEIWR